MNNKVLVELAIPDIDKTFEIFLPVNRKVGNVIQLLAKSIHDETNGLFTATNYTQLYNSKTGAIYPVDQLIRNTDIRNGSKIILM